MIKFTPIILLPVAFASSLIIPHLQTAADMEPLFQFISELPILIVTVWLFLRLDANHRATMRSMAEMMSQQQHDQAAHFREIEKTLIEALKSR